MFKTRHRLASPSDKQHRESIALPEFTHTPVLDCYSLHIQRNGLESCDPRADCESHNRETAAAEAASVRPFDHFHGATYEPGLWFEGKKFFQA